MLSLLLVAAVTLPLTGGQFNNPLGVDIWCGKSYRATNASFNPGGWFEGPAKSIVPLVNFKVRPRMNLYLEDDAVSSLIVDAEVSWYVGHAIPDANASFVSKDGSEIILQAIADGNVSLGLNDTRIKLGSKENEIPFNLSLLPASFDPHNITLIGTPQGNRSTVFHSTTQVIKLPRRSDNGTVTRIDNLYGGLSIRKSSTNDWKPLFSYTYYVQWSLYWYANLSTLDEFAAMGYNVIHIVPTGDLGNTPFPWDEFEPYLNRADELGLYFMYDVRWDYQNLTTMVDQVSHLKSHPSILLWYTGDEPDGKSVPLNATEIAYNTIRSMDPYHPVSLVLNCFDFYYPSYAAGAEIILSDVYPISTNTSWSTVYYTPCNATYGCCGCDDCTGSFEDISDRLDVYAHRDSLLGWQKTQWAAPQAFGNETFWTRYPTAAEEVVMTMLSINHAAKGIVMWDFPTEPGILAVTNKLASVLTSNAVEKFLIGAKLIGGLKVMGADRVDVTAWTLDDEVLVSIVNLDYSNIPSNVTVFLPEDTTTSCDLDVFWGDAKWSADEGKLSTSGLLGLEVSLLLMKQK